MEKASWISFFEASYRTRLLLWLALALALSLSVILVRAHSEGDGHDYALTSEAISNHLTPDVRAEDAERLSALAKAHPETWYSDSYFDSAARAIRAGSSEHVGLYRAPSGKYYDWHFWCYSALGAIPKLLLRWAGGNELRAFPFLNAAIMVLVCGYLLLGSALAPRLGVPLALLYCVTGAGFYLNWSHPEVFAVSACLLACVAFLEGKWVATALFSALGALQNPSQLLLCLLIVPAALSEVRAMPWARRGRLVAGLTAAAALGLAPFLFYQAIFGVPSLIVREEHASLGYATWGKALSLFFDLNQGMIVGIPVVLLAAIVAGVFLLVKRVGAGGSSGALRPHLLLLGAPLMSSGVLTQLNWNAGQSVFMRYAAWVSVPLLIWLVAVLQERPSWRRALGGVIGLQAAYFIFVGGFYPVSDRLSFTRFAGWVWEVAPAAYDPVPEIFAERALGREFELSRLQETPVFRGRGGDFRKILVRAEKFPELGKTLCPEGGQVLRVTGPGALSPVRAEELSGTGIDDWGYLNGRFRCG